jgi:hypothetical protein
MALKPLPNPVVGTYWQTWYNAKYDDTQKNNPRMVAVTGTERKYARMGIQECFVTFVSAVDHATGQKSHAHRLDHTKFMKTFCPVSDEELSNKLGLEILAACG